MFNICEYTDWIKAFVVICYMKYSKDNKITK